MTLPNYHTMDAEQLITLAANSLKLAATTKEGRNHFIIAVNILIEAVNNKATDPSVIKAAKALLLAAQPQHQFVPAPVTVSIEALQTLTSFDHFYLNFLQSPYADSFKPDVIEQPKTPGPEGP